MASKILIVDDDLELCELLTIRIEAAGYDVATAHDVAGALAALSGVDAVLLDLRLGGEDGFDVLDGIAKRAPDVPVIILTAHGTIDLAIEAMKKEPSALRQSHFTIMTSSRRSRT